MKEAEIFILSWFKIYLDLRYMIKLNDFNRTLYILYHVGIAVVISTRLIFSVALSTIWVMNFTNIV